jgi:epoxyqueuosine reductase
MLGNHLTRCGLCLKVCPRNARLRARGPLPYEPEEKPDCPALIPLVLADDETCRRLLPRTVVGFGIENAMGNVGDPAAVPALREAPRHTIVCPQNPARPYITDELCGLAAWPLGQIGGGEAQRALAAALVDETDPGVRGEIEAALQLPGSSATAVRSKEMCA